MKAFATTHKGLEATLSKEIGEKLDSEAEEYNTVVEFSCEPEELCKFTYRSQTPRRVLSFVAKAEFEDLEDLTKKVSKGLEDWDPKDWTDGKSFRVRCGRQGEHSFASRDVEEAVGGAIWKRIEDEGLEPEVDLEEPGVPFYIQIKGSNAWLGIDFGGRDLSVRDYKLYSHTSSVKGNVAYHLVRLSGYEKGKVLVDPFSNAGLVAIEAAKHALGRSVHDVREFAFEKLYPDTDWEEVYGENGEDEELSIYAYNDNFKTLKQAEGNAKVAMVDELVSFSKSSVEWLDTKHEEGEIDCIATYPPQNSKRAKTKDIENAYDELFYQAEYVLADEGIIVALMLSTEMFSEAAEKHGFEIEEGKKVVTGGEEYVLLRACKAKS